MLRLFVGILLTTAPGVALAAGGWEQAPLGFTLAFFAVVCLAGCIPAAGLGFLLGSFLSLKGSALVLIMLMTTPLGLIWIVSGADKVLELAPLLLGLALSFIPAIYLGWRVGRRDTLRNLNAKAMLVNGN